MAKIITFTVNNNIYFCEDTDFNRDILFNIEDGIASYIKIQNKILEVYIESLGGNLIPKWDLEFDLVNNQVKITKGDDITDIIIKYIKSSNLSIDRSRNHNLFNATALDIYGMITEILNKKFSDEISELDKLIAKENESFDEFINRIVLEEKELEEEDNELY